MNKKMNDNLSVFLLLVYLLLYGFMQNTVTVTPLQLLEIKTEPR